jgi:hypothetical protein
MADGTIVTGEAALTREASLTSQPPIADVPLGPSRSIAVVPSEAPPVATRSIAIVPSEAPSAAEVQQTDDTQDPDPVAASGSPESVAADQDASEPPHVEAPPPAAAAETAVPPVRPRNIPVEPVQPVQPAAETTTPSRTRSVQVASIEAPAAPAAAAASSGGYVVQVSSQKSQTEATAAFQGLQRRFPSIVGNLKPSIKKADLGDKGTFYRVRIGSWAARDGATAFCAKLKAAGGDCVVAKN